MPAKDKLHHIGIIPDGNRRWAVAHGLPKLKGHNEGAKAIRSIVTAAITHGVEYITIWLYSTENLTRSKTEVAHLMRLTTKLVDHIDEMNEHGVRLRVVGNLELLPKKVRDSFEKAEKTTEKNTKITLIFAAAYGGRDDIVRAFRKIAAAGYTPAQINEKLIGASLDLGMFPPMDMVIRTGGQKRLSGFFPWEMVYAELYFTDTYWPAFNEKELKSAVDWYYEQKRNFGK